MSYYAKGEGKFFVKKEEDVEKMEKQISSYSFTSVDLDKRTYQLFFDYGSYNEAVIEEFLDSIKDIAEGEFVFFGDEDIIWKYTIKNGIVNCFNGQIVYPEERNEVFIPLSNGKELVAESNNDPDYKEIFIYVRGKDRSCYQDLAIVSEDYEIEDCEIVPKPGEYEVKVYGNPDDEDWTNSFQISERPNPRTLKVEMNIDFDGNDEEYQELKKVLDHKIDALMDLESWPELSIYGVKIIEEE